MNVSGALHALPLRVQKLLAFAALFIALLGLWLLLIAPARLALDAQRSWRHGIAREIAIDRGWVQSAGRIGTLEQSVTHAAIWTQFYAADPTEAAGALRRDIAALTTSSGLSLTRTDALPAASDSDPPSVAMRIAINPSIDQLKALLAGIKSHTPYLRVQQMHVSAPLSQSRDANAPLTVTLDLYGYRADAPKMGRTAP